MKKVFNIILSFVLICFFFSACDGKCEKAIELMGAGDRIHDTYTFANVGVKLEQKDGNVYRVYGSVEKLDNESVKQEFDIDNDVTHVVAIKLSACGKDVIENKVRINIDGIRSYDAEHLNGSDYTFIILEATKGKTISINVSWNGEEETTYVVGFDEELILK